MELFSVAGAEYDNPAAIAVAKVFSACTRGLPYPVGSLRAKWDGKKGGWVVLERSWAFGNRMPTNIRQSCIDVAMQVGGMDAESARLAVGSVIRRSYLAGLK